MADRGRRAWLVLAEVLLWTSAAVAAPLREAFGELIELEPLDQAGLQAAVMERHRLSGFGHAFESALSDRGEGFVSRSASRIRRPYEQYFQDLHVATGGLIRDALRLWLASIRTIEHDDIVHVGPLPAESLSAVRRLVDEDLVLLLTIIRQGWIDADGLAAAFQIEVPVARARLAQLANLGVLTARTVVVGGGVFKKKNGDEGPPPIETLAYRVAIHLRGAVVRTLRDKGWAP